MLLIAIPLAQITFAQSELPQHRMQQTGPDLFPSIFYHSEPLSDVNRSVASFAALLVDSHRHASGAAKPAEPPK
jgi:hypothetical protein